MEITLTADQEKAKNLITEWYLNTDDLFFVLSGYAGTGKTFLINHVVKDVLHLKAGEEAVFVSPTGKAASILVKRGTPAGTVHSLIYRREEDDYDVDENGELIESERLRFIKREEINQNIKLISAGNDKIGLLKAMRETTNLGLKEAKDIIDSAPSYIYKNINEDEAILIKQKIEEVGGTVELETTEQ